MRLKTSHGTTQGTVKLSFEASGGLEQELGTDGFAKWLDHQMSVASAAVAMEFPSALRELAPETTPEEGGSNYKEAFKLTYKGTTIKVGLKLRLNVTLTDQHMAHLVGSLLASVRKHVLKHMEDKAKADEIRLAMEAEKILFDMVLRAFFPSVMSGGQSFAGLFGDGFQVDTSGSAEAKFSNPYPNFTI